MASIVSGVIEKILPNNLSNRTAPYAIASTAYGYCETAANEPIKNVDMNGFELYEGVTIHIKFKNHNTANNPQLQFNNDSNYIKDLIINENWAAGDILTLTYDGREWINNGIAFTAVDTKVSQTKTNNDASYHILLKNTNNSVNEIDGVKYSTDVSINPSTGILSAIGFSGSGSTLTNLNASNLTSGTILAARLPLATVDTIGAIKIGSGISIDNSGTISVSAANLGLANAMHFIGIVDSNSPYTPVDGDINTENAPKIPTIANWPAGSSYSPQAGDIVLDKNEKREYVYTGTNTWELLGQDASTAYSIDLDAYERITNISQATDRTITVTKASIGVLPIAHGGTGVDSFNADQVIVSGTGATMTLTSRAYSDSDHAEALGTSTNFVTERDIYYGLPQINHNHNYNSGTDLYAPLNSGNNGQILISGGSNTEPVWSIAATLNSNTESEADTAAYTTLTLGNNTNVSSTAAHSEGQIKLYSAATHAHIITGTSTMNDYTHILPNNDGVLVQTATNANGTVGSTTQPVYINDNVVTAITYTQYRLYYSASTSSFTATNHYANENQIGLNITTLPNGNTDTLYVNGTTSLNGNVTITGNLIPSSTNTYTLGIGAGATNNPLRWQKLYIGTADSYGDDDNDTNHNIVPIYWNNGVPTPLSSSVGDAYTPIYLNGGSITKVSPVQYCAFTIDTGNTGVRLSHSAFNADSYVLQIVVTEGEQFLDAPIAWESKEGAIELTTSTSNTPNNTISGYIIVCRGTTITATPTQLPEETTPESNT